MVSRLLMQEAQQNMVWLSHNRKRTASHRAIHLGLSADLDLFLSLSLPLWHPGSLCRVSLSSLWRFQALTPASAPSPSYVLPSLSISIDGFSIPLIACSDFDRWLAPRLLPSGLSTEASSFPISGYLSYSSLSLLRYLPLLVVHLSLISMRCCRDYIWC